jgi:regulator of protease activity HflC (stomatin/prohibitin superfamily)
MNIFEKMFVVVFGIMILAILLVVISSAVKDYKKGEFDEVSKLLHFGLIGGIILLVLGLCSDVYKYY